MAHQGFATALAAGLKKHKIITINSLHLHDFTDLGRQFGNTQLGLAYEHAFDYLCPCSYELGNWLKGFGVPYDKVIPIQNAAGFELDSTKNEKLFAGRLEKERDQNLNILYIGRLDKQKGLHRLSKLYQETCHLDKFNWRVIGKSVIMINLLLNQAVLIQLSHLFKLRRTAKPMIGQIFLYCCLNMRGFHYQS